MIRFLTILFFLSGSLFTAPLKNIPQKVTQPDGSILECFASGDEYHNWLHDENGYTIIQNRETGWYLYADLARGELVPTRFIPDRDDPAKAGLKPETNISVEEVLEKRANFENASPADMGQAPRSGILNNITIFIRFSDQNEYEDPISLYDNMFNDVSSSANTMYNYFREVSYNQLEISTTFYPAQTGGMIVSYQDIYPRNYYAPYSVTNTIGYKNDYESMLREHKLLKRAVEAIAEDVPATLNVDGDGDGKVDNVCFVIQGETTAWSTLLWPHRWALYTEVAYINNKRVYDYNFQLDAMIYNGVLAHEMFHSLGAPDLYHYSHDGHSPAGSWDLMGANQQVPQHMGAYMKYKYGGWINSIPEITESGTYELNQLTSSTNNAFKIASPNSSSEYYLVEYRKNEGVFESSLPGEGLLVYRINPAIHGNADGPPDEVYIYRPNGNLEENGNLYQAAFSNNSGRTSINDFTNPSSFLGDGSAGGLSIKNVGRTNNTITFEVSMGCDLNVFFPNGAEVFEPDKNIDIYWDGVSASKLDIQLFKDNSFYRNIVSGTDNDGVYSWSPSDIPQGDDYKIKILDSFDQNCYDFSDGAFTINQENHEIQVVSPNGGEEWNNGETYEILWNDNINENVEIDLYKSGEWSTGGDWVLKISSSTESDGSYYWTIPSDLTASHEYKIRIGSVNNDQLKDYTDDFFSIEPEIQTPIITQQPGNVTVNQGRTAEFEVSAICNEPLSYQWWRVPFVSVSESKLTDVPGKIEGANSHTLKILNVDEADDGTQYLCEVKNSTYYAADGSWINSTVAQLNVNILEVLSPNGDENWGLDKEYTIRWEDNIDENVSIDLFLDNELVKNITSSTASDGGFAWKVSKDLSEAYWYKIRIRSVNDFSLEDYSDADFSILRYVNTPEPPILLSPANNLQNQNLNPTFKWEASKDAATYTLEVSSDASFSNIELEHYTSSTEYTSTDNKLDYSSKYYWRVMAENDLGFSNWSDIWNFQTKEEPYIKVVSPNGDENWLIGDSYEIKWEDNLSDNVEISLYEDGEYTTGGNWKRTISSNTESDGSFMWTVPDDIEESNNYKIRIGSVETSTINDYTDGFFSIEEKLNPPIIISQTESAICNQGGSAFFKVNAFCEDSIDYQWWKFNRDDSSMHKLSDVDGKIAGSTSESLYLYDLNKIEDSTYYVCEIRNIQQFPKEGSSIYSNNLMLRVKYLEILYPNEGSNFSAGETINVSWIDNIDEKVKLDLYQGGISGEADGIYIYTIIDSTQSNGVYGWQIPNSLPDAGNYKIRMSSIWDQSLEAFSHFSTITDVEMISSNIPTEFYLRECYPNPFNPSTKIEFGIPEEMPASLEVYNIAGQLVSKLLDNEMMIPGVYEYIFEAENLSSGIYFFRLATNKTNIVKKGLLMK